MTDRELQRKLLLARCELDRRELQAEVGVAREKLRDRVHRLKRLSPWLLAVTPVAGFLVVRAVRQRNWGGFRALGQLAAQWPVWWPLVRDVLLREHRPPRN